MRAATEAVLRTRTAAPAAPARRRTARTRRRGVGLHLKFSFDNNILDVEQNIRRPLPSTNSGTQNRLLNFGFEERFFWQYLPQIGRLAIVNESRTTRTLVKF